MFRNRISAAAAVLLCLAALAAPAEALQQATVSGRILDPTGAPVPGARVEVAGSEVAASNEDGRFRFALATGGHELRIYHPAYQVLERVITVAGRDLELELALRWVTTVSESLTVEGIRAGDEVPVSKHNMAREEIEDLSYGQDVPALLQYTPSMNWYSDSGTGSNYSYFSLRGIQQTRINITFDGAPLNDPAEHALYFNNFHDFTSAVDSIQIQRGVGTSSVGTPAYGGSVNFASSDPSLDAHGDARLVLGSFGTARGSLAYDSGLFGNGFWASGRFSYSTTDGYRDNSGNEHDTFFWNAGWQGEHASIKFNGFSGREKGQLSYLAVEPDVLAENRRFNPLTPEDQEAFGQDFAQLKYSQLIGDATLLTASLYYNSADGWFQLWDDPVAQTDLLRFGIDQGFVGSMVTVGTAAGDFAIDAGFHYNDFAGDHFLDSDAFGRLYTNTGHKKTANGFAKIEYRIADTLLYGDVQLRWAEFAYQGDLDLGSVDWTFVDPKVGVRQRLSPHLSLYASIGRAQREPARLDLLLGEDNATVPHDLEAVKPESVIDFELGVDYNSPRWAVAANFYAMEFRDEIALTGELSEIGLPLRRNVDRSYRRGAELDLRWMPLPRWALTSSLNINRSRIDQWTQFYDVYDGSGSWVGSEPITHSDVPYLLTPPVTLNLGAEYATPATEVAVVGRHVAAAHLDNTGVDALRTPAYTTIDVRAAQSLGRWWPGAQPRLRVFLNNLLNSEDAYPSGYSYQFLTRDGDGNDTLSGIPYYYPLATFTARVILELSF